MNISLTPEFTRFVQSKVESGIYTSSKSYDRLKEKIDAIAKNKNGK